MNSYKFRPTILALAAALICFANIFQTRVLAQPSAGPPPLIDRELFFGDPEIAGAQISPDGKYIVFVQDKAGDENYLVYAVNPADAPAKDAEVPAARNLTDVKGVRAQIYAVPRTDPDLIYVGLNDRDKAWHDLYKVKISTGERTLVRQNTERIV